MLLLVASTLSFLCVGCSYTIEGQVLRGAAPSMGWVDDGAPLPDGEVVAGASVVIFRDPDSMHPAQSGVATSGADGRFTLPVSGAGAGWMQESWHIRAARKGAGAADWIGSLPSSSTGRLLVIVLAPESGDVGLGKLWRGDVGRRESGASIMDEVNRYK
ncbi:MAG: hypothetical protein SGJ09_08570 [Phycisphaerae bacterium]|nr:hypothetical protein [Phycisphaerae bacterium]